MLAGNSLKMCVGVGFEISLTLVIISFKIILAPKVFIFAKKKQKQNRFLCLRQIELLILLREFFQVSEARKGGFTMPFCFFVLFLVKWEGEGNCLRCTFVCRYITVTKWAKIQKKSKTQRSHTICLKFRVKAFTSQQQYHSQTITTISPARLSS